MLHSHKNIILEPEVAADSFSQEVYIGSIELTNYILDNLWRFIVGALIGYVIYLTIILGTPATPVAATSSLSPEQNREGLAESMGVLAGISTLMLCHVNWRMIWRWLPGSG